MLASEKVIGTPRQFFYDGEIFVTGQRRHDCRCRKQDIVRFEVDRKKVRRAHPNFGRIVAISCKGFATIAVTFEDDVKFIRRKLKNLTWIASNEMRFVKAEVDRLPFFELETVLGMAGAEPIPFNDWF